MTLYRRTQSESGLTAIELLCAVVGFIGAGVLAGVAARHVEGAWRWVVAVGVFVVGYVAIFLALFFSLFWLVAHLPDGTARSAESHGGDKPKS